MKRKSDLLRACEQRLILESVNDWLDSIKLAYLVWQNRRTAKKLARRRML